MKPISGRAIDCDLARYPNGTSIDITEASEGDVVFEVQTEGGEFKAWDLTISESYPNVIVDLPKPCKFRFTFSGTDYVVVSNT